MDNSNLNNIREKVLRAKELSPSDEDISIVAVIKNQPTEAANELIKNGFDIVAENRVQALKDRGDELLPAKRHLIGHLQTNKVKTAVYLSDMIQSVDSLRLLTEINKQAQIFNKNMDILIQINIANEAAKFGANKEDITLLLTAASEMEHLSVRGLMAIMPIETKMLYYQEMYEIFIDNRQKIMHNIYGENISMDFLSMGMSGDYEQAISCGANMVRLGRCLFD